MIKTFSLLLFFNSLPVNSALECESGCANIAPPPELSMEILESEIKDTHRITIVCHYPSSNPKGQALRTVRLPEREITGLYYANKFASMLALKDEDFINTLKKECRDKIKKDIGREVEINNISLSGFRSGGLTGLGRKLLYKGTKYLTMLLSGLQTRGYNTFRVLANIDFDKSIDWDITSYDQLLHELRLTEEFMKILEETGEEEKISDEKTGLVKKLTHDISLQMIYYAYQHSGTKYKWYNEIPLKNKKLPESAAIFLGGIPLIDSQDETYNVVAHMLEEDKVNRVLSMVEPFEFHRDKFVKPATPKMWKKLKEQGKNIEQKQIPTQDFKPVSLKNIAEGVAYLKTELKEGNRVYVHCKAGVGRSAMIVVAYFAESMGLEEALKYVKSIRPQTNIGPAQEAMLKKYVDSLGAKEPGHI